MTTTTDFVNFYTLLGIAETVDAEGVQKAIRDQRRLWNKRAGQSDPVKRAQAEERIRELAEAERVLLDPYSRQQFDQYVREYRPEAPARASGTSGARDWLVAAKEYAAAGNAPSAYFAAREAIAVDGANHQAWSIRANSSFLMGKFPDAEFEFKEAIGLQPDNPGYHFDYAEAFAAMGQWGPALGEYEIALRQRPGYPMYRTAIANVYIQNNMPEAALEMMEAVVRENPDNPSFEYYLALALHDTNLAKWTKLANGRFILTSPAQINITRQMSGRALRLKFDDPALRASLEDNVRRANYAERVTWSRSEHTGAYIFLIVCGVLGLGLMGAGLLILVPTIAAYVIRHHTPVWKQNSKQFGITAFGI